MNYEKLANAYRAIAKANPKDRIEVEIGDTKQADFFPQVKLMRWDNEVNFSARLIPDALQVPVKGKQPIIPPSFSMARDKVVYNNGNITSKFYDLAPSDDLPEGGYEFEITLNKKPTSNVVTFSLQTKGLEFFYQPELEDSEVEEFAKNEGITLLEAKRQMRPENVVGSYAVYYKNCPANYVGGKEYKTGKAFHIYRPKIQDANGAWTWGELNITDGLMTVTIPQEFLDKAVYPVTHAAGATFGYTSVGATSQYNSELITTSLHRNYGGTVSKISSYNAASSSANYGPSKCAIYTDGIGAPKVPNSESNEITIGSTTPVWRDYTTASSPVVTPNVYNVSFWCDKFTYYYYDTVAYGVGYMKSLTYAAWPATISWSGFPANLKFSIYATYTADTPAFYFGQGTTGRKIATYSGTTVAPTIPFETVENDLLVAVIVRTAVDTDPTGVPTGWTLAGKQSMGGTNTAPTVWCYYKLAGTSESTPTWTFAVASQIGGIIYSYFGNSYDTSNPIDAISSTSYLTSNTTVRAASMTVSAANSPLIFIAVVNGNVTFANPSAPTSGWFNGHDATDVRGNYIRSAAMLWTGSGATGNIDSTISASATKKAGFAIALNPPAGGGSSVNATVAQTSASISITGGTQSISTTQIVSSAIAQTVKDLILTSGTQSVTANAISYANATIDQLYADIALTTGTQTVTSSQYSSITQTSQLITITNGTQAISTVNKVQIDQLKAGLTISTGTQAISTVNNAQISQEFASLTLAGGNQSIGAIINAGVLQVAKELTISTGTQLVGSSVIANATILQSKAILSLSGGLQAIKTTNYSTINQISQPISITGGIQELNGSAIAIPIKININGWKDVATIKINLNGWKDVTHIKQARSGVWTDII